MFEDRYLPSVFDKKLNIFQFTVSPIGKFRLYTLDGFAKNQALLKDDEQQCDSASEHLLKVQDIIKDTIKSFTPSGITLHPQYKTDMTLYA